MSWPRPDRIAHLGLVALEIVITAILGTLVVLAVAGLAMELPAIVRPPFLDPKHLGDVLDHVLAVFVLIELLATAVAYVRGRDILRQILEAALVAIARKLIGLDFSSGALEKSVALAILFLAVASSWWILTSAKRQANGGTSPST